MILIYIVFSFTVNTDWHVSCLFFVSEKYISFFFRCYQLEFLQECWQVLVDGALALWRQIGTKSLKDSLVEPPLKPGLLPQAISAVWSLCYSYSSINRSRR